ncbi:Scr1 family TA system antitoxin-like transcriptional regulator [Nocardiopsis oceani]
MHHQLQHLINMANHHNIDLQVLPFSAGMHSALAGSFYFLDFPGELNPSIVYTENATDSLFVQDSESIQCFVAIFSDLNAAALRAPQSVRLIRQIMESLDHHEHD